MYCVSTASFALLQIFSSDVKILTFCIFVALDRDVRGQDVYLKVVFYADVLQREIHKNNCRLFWCF